MFATLMGEYDDLLVRRRELNLAPPHVQNIDIIERVIPEPARKNRPLMKLWLRPATPADNTPREKSKVTVLIVVKITWAHHENQLKRRKIIEALFILGSISVPSWFSCNEVVIKGVDRSTMQQLFFRTLKPSKAWP